MHAEQNWIVSSTFCFSEIIFLYKKTWQKKERETVLYKSKPYNKTHPVFKWIKKFKKEKFLLT